MATAETAFDVLQRIARDLDIGFVSGALQPPEAGRIWLGGQSLAEILLPEWSGRRVALAVTAGGPGHRQVRRGGKIIDMDGLARLIEGVEASSGHVYQGRLALLTPADWLQIHGPPPNQPDLAVLPPRQGYWQDDPTNAITASLDTDATVEAARKAGWPATFANEPVLFLDDTPVYHLLMRENVGRVATLLIAALEERQQQGA